MTVGGDLVPARLGAQSAVCCAAPEYEGTRTLGWPRCTAAGVQRRVGGGCPPTVINTQSKSKSQYFNNKETQKRYEQQKRQI